MENFDIEHLERKNIYKTPDDFFARVQENVLKQTVGAEIKPLPVVQTSSAKNTWWYAVAAALVMLFGLGIYFNMNKGTAGPTVAKTVPQPVRRTEIQPVQQSVVAINEVKEAASVAKPEITKPVAPPVRKETVRYKKTEAKTLAVREVATKTDEKELKPALAPAQVAEDILASLSKDDVALLANETQNDVYLELYN